MKLATKLLSGVALTLALINNASAASLNVTDGILMGASGVSVNGELYDVEFKDGLIGNSLNTFTTYQFTLAASQALLNQVFTGIYDSQPNLTNGCTSTVDCNLITAYSTYLISGKQYHSFYTARNSSTESSDVGYISSTISTNDISKYSTYTLAIWTKQATATAVPEPEAYAMMLAGLGLVGFAARRKQQAA